LELPSRLRCGSGLSRYVEFHKDNFNCFSIEIARILLASASEVDVVCKRLCKKIDAKSKANDIHAYRDTIRPAFPPIATFAVRFPRFDLTLSPWDEWKKKRGVPIWWSDYNKVKHQRDAFFERANLKNALNTVAGLFVMVLYLYSEKARLAQLVPPPQVLHVTSEHYLGTACGQWRSRIQARLTPERRAGSPRWRPMSARRCS